MGHVIIARMFEGELGGRLKIFLKIIGKINSLDIPNPLSIFLLPKHMRNAIHWQIVKRGFAKGIKARLHFIHGVTAEFFDERFGKDKGDHGTPDQLSAEEEAWWRSVSSRHG